MWLLAPLLFANAWAQNYPVKPVRFVVPFAPGGGTDSVARTIAQKLTDAWGPPVVVDNRAGATGAIASALVARAPADGYALLMVTSSTHAILPSLQSNLPYDPVKDFAPVTLVSTSPQVMVVHPSVPASSVKELVALANTRSLNYASGGVGSLPHMMAELFRTVTAANIAHIPYKGASGAATALLGGEVQMTFGGPVSVSAHVRSRRLRALAVTSARRIAGFEDAPTFIEAGYPTLEVMQWYGVVTTVGTPKWVVDKLNHEISRIMQLPEVKEQILASGSDPAFSSPQAFAQMIKDDFAKWQKVVKATGIRLD